MKIIALLPVKNEAWILPTYLSSVQPLVDEIIALNDQSTDETEQILKDAGVHILNSTSQSVNMSQKRTLLLNEGRKRGGTHFIWLDADEIISGTFVHHARERIASLEPGQKIAFRWVTLWKSLDTERVDAPWGNNFKDIIVCDAPNLAFEDKVFSEHRTPGPHTNVITIDESEGVVLHFQFVNFESALFKQAWYRCNELIETKRSPRRINHMYSITKDTEKVITKNIPSEWTPHMVSVTRTDQPSWHLNSIEQLFNTHGIETFEELDIWGIPRLHTLFLEKTHREPHPKIYPFVLIYLKGIYSRLFS